MVCYQCAACGYLLAEAAWKQTTQTSPCPSCRQERLADFLRVVYPRRARTENEAPGSSGPAGDAP
jgi:DNA-directed RNA polymerase subunit RPC12/RpoP